MEKEEVKWLDRHDIKVIARHVIGLNILLMIASREWNRIL